MTGEELRRARLRLKMTQRRLAKELGIHWNTVARSERGEMAIHRTTELAVKYFLVMSKKPRRKKR
jgi:transcriptional regulator with XRE-family HTH domain